MFRCQARPVVCGGAPCGGAGVLLVVGWLWVEMCIVDASILFSVVFGRVCVGLCVVGKW